MTGINIVLLIVVLIPVVLIIWFLLWVYNPRAAESAKRKRILCQLKQNPKVVNF